MKYLIIIECTTTGYSAYSTDVPGCVATGSTREATEREMRDAVAFHLDGLKAEGVAIPDVVERDHRSGSTLALTTIFQPLSRAPERLLAPARRTADLCAWA